VLPNPKLTNITQRPRALDALRVRRENLSEQVAQQIQQLIIEGNLRPGDRLPPER
jgi:DNA-binding FadR family transcriptional regulator